jgi:xanthine dehydrogenase small subunit
MTHRPIRFFHRGDIVEVNDAAPTRTVLEWLREDAHCTGTKEGCAEGDCGACTVVLGELNERGALALSAVNACIQFLPTLDGKALFTVEDLKAVQKEVVQHSGADDLHPVQRAMVECHGSQCGFCTPGFVMSLWFTYERHQACGTQPSRQQLADDLSGNLCRCTGYRPILDAGQRMFELPAARLETAPVAEALQRLRADDATFPTFHYRNSFHAPKTLAELARLRAERPDATVLAGSTDIGLWATKQFKPLPDLIYIGEVAELKTIHEENGFLHIGAGASLETAWSALARHWPSVQDVWLRFASPPIRNAGTMGGNVANGSPIGDCAPALIALDAVIVLRQGDRVREMPLADFYVGYMKNRLERGEFVQALRLPLPSHVSVAGRKLAVYKISKRFDCDITAVCAALAIALDGEAVSAVRFAYGGMAAIVQRAAHAEAAVLGQAWSQDTVHAAMQALAGDFTPLTDMRASAAYRMQVARNLLQRFWLETRPANPLPTSNLSVWSVMPHVTAPTGEPA